MNPVERLDKLRLAASLLEEVKADLTSAKEDRPTKDPTWGEISNLNSLIGATNCLSVAIHRLENPTEGDDKTVSDRLRDQFGPCANSECYLWLAHAGLCVTAPNGG